MDHPRITISIDVSTEPYGQAAVHVYESRTLAAMKLDKPSDPSRQQWEELAAWLPEHVERAVEEVEKQLRMHATAAREDTAEVTELPVA